MSGENDDGIERLLAAAKPRNAPAELRAMIIAAVAAELDLPRNARQPAWQIWLGRTVAASLLFSLAVFAGVDWFEARRMARWDERSVVRSDVAALTAAIASVTDEKSARAIERYLLSRLQEGVRAPSTAMHKEVQEIERWAEVGPFAERSDPDDAIQKSI